MADIVLVSIVGGFATLLGGLIVYISNKQLNKSNVNSINADTIIKLSKRIDELETRDSLKEKRIDDLEAELRKFRKAYTRAIKWIHETVPPTVDIPDFFLDTGELNKPM